MYNVGAAGKGIRKLLEDDFFTKKMSAFEMTCQRTISDRKESFQQRLDNEGKNAGLFFCPLPVPQGGGHRCALALYSERSSPLFLYFLNERTATTEGTVNFQLSFFFLFFLLRFRLRSVFKGQKRMSSLLFLEQNTNARTHSFVCTHNIYTQN